MSTEMVAVMLGVSLVLGLLGLLAFIWGLKNGQFDDANKMMQGVLFDSVEDLNLAAKATNKSQNTHTSAYKQKEKNKMENIYDVAIIGGGPGGVSAAIESVILGIKNVILLEKSDNHSATIQKFYKDGKRVDKDYKGQKIDLEGNIPFVDGTKESTISFFDELLQHHNIPVKYQSDIESINKKDNIFVITNTQNKTYQARYVVIAIGKMGQPNKPSYPIPSSIRKIVSFNVNDCQNNEKILIVGGGNSAVEYACMLAQNADVTLNYRRKEFTRINETNAEQLTQAIEQNKLKTRLGVDIVELFDDNGKVGVRFSDENKETFDRAIYAIGGASPVDFLKKCHLEIDEKGVPLCNDLHESSMKNCFVAGDIGLKSGGSIALAIKHGYEIANEIKRRES
ncbi:cbb3-type cytochrome oxidase assembly protein CcoS [Helicobacter sp. MIT 05-5293]|uniref:cbb3-type cytochrome oxidase assembly protein CcoS n=1 Tax=Helicobacter sp. MIT 05-5293 TaxID=1548149 RepID=UPI0009DE9DEA|nr:cbb3-type cytochrome oxidase assembly protein CcoS [Helicobacter sp. MIT 05-5293]TLD80769.1 cbb3-type cytochrome oxidase assembly protein CcoS [Helicobacter sp. MIT 05-5293]